MTRYLVVQDRCGDITAATKFAMLRSWMENGVRRFRVVTEFTDVKSAIATVEARGGLVPSYIAEFAAAL